MPPGGHAGAMTCQMCGVMQVIPPPRDDTRVIRFCLVLYPRRLCMYCCPCAECRRRCLSRARGPEGYTQWLAEVTAINELLYTRILHDQWLAELRVLFRSPDAREFQ
jgi:hypothetical protein